MSYLEDLDLTSDATEYGTDLAIDLAEDPGVLYESALRPADATGSGFGVLVAAVALVGAAYFARERYIEDTGGRAHSAEEEFDVGHSEDPEEILEDDDFN